MPILNNLTIQDKTGLYREFEVGELAGYTALVSNTTTTKVIDLTGIQNIQGYALQDAYAGNTNITGTVDFSDLVYLSGTSCLRGAFSGCTGITGADLGSLTTITGSSACRETFKDCTALTNVNLSSLEVISGDCQGMFSGCSSLQSIDLSLLHDATIASALTQMFADCSALTNVNLSSLTAIGYTNCCTYMFARCTNLTSLSFPNITNSSFGSRINQFNFMCESIPNITLHFPANVQAKIESLTGYSATAPFGAASGTVLFDLPQTMRLMGADGNPYNRNPKYDTGTALSWHRFNYTTPYYTSGTTEPSVGDTIYSDAACTVAVTTIDSITVL